jgi:hypothetical protein
MPFYYFYVVDNITADMMERELKEVADYVSHTLGNLYFLANSTRLNVSLQKQLDLPANIQGSSYFVEIVYTIEDDSALYVLARSKDQPDIYVNSWLPPGLTANEERCKVESIKETIIVECISNTTGFWVAIEAE